jgi:hypothetical protein
LNQPVLFIEVNMKTYLVSSQTNCSLMVHVVNAKSGDEAIRIATTGRMPLAEPQAWPGCTVDEIDTTKKGVVLVK